MVQDTVGLPRGRGPPGVRRHGALLRRLQARPGLRRPPPGRRGRGGRVGRRPVRHERRHAAARHVRDRHRRQGSARACAWASTARTTPAARSPTRSPAVEAGVTHVQCTANGYGERTGNADLFVVVPNLQLKLGIDCLPEGALAETVRISHAIAEIANIAPNTHQPYAGWASFAHKAGLHASALKVNAELYNHIDPAIVGNAQNVLVTEMAGRASIELKGAELGHDLVGPARGRHRRRRAGQGSRVAGLDLRGGRRVLRAADPGRAGQRGRPSRSSPGAPSSSRTPTATVKSEATVKVHIDGERIISTAEGNGPVNALDRAMRRAIVQTLPGPRHPAPGRLQGAHPRREVRHRCQDARAHRHDRRARTRGARSACTRTSSRPRGARSRTAVKFGLLRRASGDRGR